MLLCTSPKLSQILDTSSIKSAFAAQDCPIPKSVTTCCLLVPSHLNKFSKTTDKILYKGVLMGRVKQKCRVDDTCYQVPSL